MGDSAGTRQTIAYAINNVLYERKFFTGLSFLEATVPLKGQLTAPDLFFNDGRHAIQGSITSNRRNEFHVHQARNGGQQGEDDIGQGYIRGHAMYAACTRCVEDWTDGVITDYAI
jgi:hypothetical protein